ncbi:hypothetical protein [Oerskovia turbata]
MRTAVVTTTVLLSAAVLAGCKGGESGGQPTPTPTVTTIPAPTTPVEPTPTPTPSATPTDPTTPPGENEVSIRVEIPERTAAPTGG